MYRAWSLISILCCSALFAGSSNLRPIDSNHDEPSLGTNPDEVWPTAGWATATPAEMGLDPTLLEQARDYALTGGGSGYITRGGRLVLSWGNPDQLYDMKSATKSIGVT